MFANLVRMVIRTKRAYGFMDDAPMVEQWDVG
jgi:hypothetical protein